jgi:hypothetical protein
MQMGTVEQTIWKGKITAGQETKVFSTDGHIRYHFTRDPGQLYQGDIAVGCYQGKEILVD